MTDEILTDEQMLAEAKPKSSPLVYDLLEGHLKAHAWTDTLPLHAIRKDLKLVPVRCWKRVS